MVSEIELLLWLDISWNAREENNQSLGKDLLLLAEKALLEKRGLDINSPREVRLFELAAIEKQQKKNDKTKAEEQDTDKLRKLCSEKKACRRKWLVTLYLSSGRCECTYYILKHNWDRDINDFATTTQVQVAINICQWG